MLLIGVPGHNVALGSDNVRRAIPPRSDRLGFVEFNRLPVINIGTESRFYGVNIALRFFAVLHGGPITGPREAVRAAIVAEARSNK